MFWCQVRPFILGHQINFKYDGEWLISWYFWALKGCHEYLWKYGMVMMMILGLNFRHDIFHFQWRGGTQKVDKNFEIVLNKKWNTLSLACLVVHAGMKVHKLCSFYYHCRKKINTVFSALIITFIVQMNHPKKSISLLIFTPFYESLQLYIESKKNDKKGGGITDVCLLFNHNAANFCRLQKSKCMVNQIIHHFYNGCTYYLS